MPPSVFFSDAQFVTHIAPPVCIFVNVIGRPQHRDLKLANCMFEDTSAMPIVKIIDFGLCAEFKDGHTSTAFVGTMTYAAPEVRTGTDSCTAGTVQHSTVQRQ